MMAEVIYGLCALLSLAIALLLWRQWRRQPGRLIFWAALCFSGLALANIVLVLDKIVFPELELAWLRNAISLLSIGVLLFGLIYEED